MTDSGNGGSDDAVQMVLVCALVMYVTDSGNGGSNVSDDAACSNSGN